MKLLKSLKKPTTVTRSVKYECSAQMSNRDEDSSCSTHTLEWIESVNRGKLLVVNECTFTLFKAVEVKTRQVLPLHLIEESACKKARLIKAIVEDRMVQIHWQRVEKNIGDDASSQELLQMLVDVGDDERVCFNFEVDGRVQAS